MTTDKQAVVGWKYIKNNVDVSNIKNFEKLTSYILDEKLIPFILSHNNGRPIKNELMEEKSGKEFIFDKLLSFNEDDVENVFTTYKSLQGSIDENLIPLAIDPSGNYFCLARNSKNVIFYWHETGLEYDLNLPLLSLIDKLV
ncbi:hypothetical protein DC083_08980 [Ignatzschineria ureiclastica]|uniref:Knr4/Smi1-like domain-containing protein n=1 Tax=Ignatzschineria ureiclastica TaxID=472582 RepID=A0A2U2ACQ6_9GAMM|nr:SMI1/KNR4 family protein [Ignatzschineria ureiclastica]PWD80438.1 hypothetical protein DC083_08980 [Ignatzschineria ureiclastica]GGZ99519.1 hypothetical protein GCM10007162_14580 [Ignatzschineria ureiclastica]